MTTLAAIFLWSIALAAHALRQPKICRVLSLPQLAPLPLAACRVALPLIALALCLRAGLACGMLTWLAAGSVAGVVASLALTFIAFRRTRGGNLTDLPARAV